MGKENENLRFGHYTPNDFYDFNKSYDKISSLIQDLRGETDEERKMADAAVYANGQLGRNDIPLVNLYDPATSEKIYVCDAIKKTSSPKISKKNKFVAIAMGALVATSIFGGVTNMVNNANEEHFTEVTPAEVYNDADGFTTFDSVFDLDSYCKEHDLNISDVKGFSDSSGKFYVSNSSISKVNDKIRHSI